MASRAEFGNFVDLEPCAAGFALFARCAVTWLGHDAAISTHVEPPMKAHWPDWLMAITLLIAIAAAALSDPVQWPDPAALIR